MPVLDIKEHFPGTNGKSDDSWTRPDYWPRRDDSFNIGRGPDEPKRDPYIPPLKDIPPPIAPKGEERIVQQRDPSPYDSSIARTSSVQIKDMNPLEYAEVLAKTLDPSLPWENSDIYQLFLLRPNSRERILQGALTPPVRLTVSDESQESMGRHLRSFNPMLYVFNPDTFSEVRDGIRYIREGRKPPLYIPEKPGSSEPLIEEGYARFACSNQFGNAEPFSKWSRFVVNPLRLHGEGDAPALDFVSKVYVTFHNPKLDLTPETLEKFLGALLELPPQKIEVKMPNDDPFGNSAARMCYGLDNLVVHLMSDPSAIKDVIATARRIFGDDRITCTIGCDPESGTSGSFNERLADWVRRSLEGEKGHRLDLPANGKQFLKDYYGSPELL